MIGYMPDFFGVYDDMKVIEYLEFFAAAYRINGPARPQDVRRGARAGRPRLQARRARHQPVARHDAAARPGPRAAARPAGAAARRAGQRPRPAGPHRDARRCSKSCATMGKTIMVSSHILPELADICNKIGIIERGELLVNADVADVMKQVRQQTLLQHRRGRRLRQRRRKLLEGTRASRASTRAGQAARSSRSPRASATTATWPAC